MFLLAPPLLNQVNLLLWLLNVFWVPPPAPHSSCCDNMQGAAVSVHLPLPPSSNIAALDAAQSGRYLIAAGPAVPWCMRALHRSLPTCTAVGLVGAGLQGTAPPPQDPQSLAPAQDRFGAAPGLQQPPRVAAQSRHGSAHNSYTDGEWSPARAWCQGCSSWPAAEQDHKCAAILLNCGVWRVLPDLQQRPSTVAQDR